MGKDGKDKNNENIPGHHDYSDIRQIYLTLASGVKLTSLDAVFLNDTVCLPKYISILRNRYNIPIKDRWIIIGKKDKRVKEYWIDLDLIKKRK